RRSNHKIIIPMINKLFASVLLSTCFVASSSVLLAQTVPLIKEGEAQIVEGFNTPDKWIREDLWVETEFDTDGDGKPDRMHVDVTRPFQTETENLKLPVIYETSPYYAGTAQMVDGIMWNVEHELGEKAPTARVHPEVKRTGERPIISNSLIREWV